MKMMFQSGVHSSSSKPDYSKAALYYQVAAESEHSAVAMYSLAYMHEHGFGLPRDLHLAKRYYDNALTTNPSAYLPINLSLAKLTFKMLFLGGWSAGDDTDKDNVGEEDAGVEDLPPVLPALEIEEDGGEEFIEGLEGSDEEEGMLGNVLLACVLVYMVWKYGM
jgi:TPR repeat protein